MSPRRLFVLIAGNFCVATSFLSVGGLLSAISTIVKAVQGITGPALALLLFTSDVGAVLGSLLSVPMVRSYGATLVAYRCNITSATLLLLWPFVAAWPPRSISRSVSGIWAVLASSRAAGKAGQRCAHARRLMMLFRGLAALLALLAPQLFQVSAASDAGASHRESVVLLHGLARSSDSMSRMARALEAAGYHVCNVSYPSRKHSIEVLAADFVAPAVRTCRSNETDAVYFVTHSLGGIIVRQLAQSEADLKIGRVVMLSPPNHGSEVVDRLGTLSLFTLINGPAGLQLATGEEYVPRSLGPASFDVGIITGSRTVNPILSLLIAGDDDGKVSIESAKLDGMKDFCVIPATHPFIMNNNQAIAQTIAFLANGRFNQVPIQTALLE